MEVLKINKKTIDDAHKQAIELCKLAEKAGDRKLSKLALDVKSYLSIMSRGPIFED
jgi:hypothetical protein